MFLDWGYMLFVLLPGMILSGIASLLVRTAFSRYSQVPSARGMTGAQAAKLLLDRADIRDVEIVPSHGFLSDHYNPITKQLALSPDVYQSDSIAAIGVACHEAGHAIQHAHGYAPLWIRSMLVPAASIGSNLGYFVMIMGLMLNNKFTFLIGVALFSAVVLFQFVTLPVEFDASARAKQLAFEYGIVTAQERTGVSRVLNAAALTYVAAAVTSLLTLLYYLLRSGILGGRSEE